VLTRLLGERVSSPRHLAMVFFAWHPGGDAEEAPGGAERASVGHAGEAGRSDITRMQKPRRARDLRFKPMTYSLF